MNTPKSNNDTSLSAGPVSAGPLTGSDARQALRRATDARLSSALVAGEIGAWSWEIGTQRVICDEFTARLLSIDADVGLNGITREMFFQAVLAEDHEAVLSGLAEAQNATDLHEADYRVRHANGEVRWLRSRGRAEVDQDGRVIRRQGIVMDVTAQKLSEARLRTMTDLLQTSQSIAQLGGWELDIKSGEVFWTGETYRIHDTSPEAFSPTVDACVDYFLTESRLIIIAALDAAMTQGTDYDLELEARTSKGRLINVRTTCVVTFVDGVPVKLTGIIQDITTTKRAERLSREGRERYQMLVETTQSMVTITDLDGRYTYVNDQTAVYLGFSVEEAIGRQAIDFVHRDDRERLRQWIADSIAVAEAKSSFEIRMLLRDGTVGYFLWNAKILCDDKGRPTHISSIAHDVTERRRAQQERERLAAIVESSADAIISRTLDGKVTSLNAAAEKLFGFMAEEAIGVDIRLLISPEMYAEEMKVLSNADPESPAKHFETVRPSKDGRAIHVSAMISPINDADGQVIGVGGIFRDITDRKLSEATARENQARHKLAVQVADIGPWDWDLITGDVNFSAEWKAQIGFSEDEISGDFSEFESRLHPEDRGRILASVDNFRADPSSGYSVDFRLQHKDRSYRWIHTRALIISDAKGLQTRMIGAHVDMTERKNREKQAFRSQRLESLGTLAGGVAHDLNNALAPILMSVELLRMDYPTETATIDLIEANALRGANMVRQLLTFPRGASGERVAVGVGTLITEMQNLMQGTFPKNLQIQVVCEPTLPIVMGDATQLHQLLLNLCVNARDAMPEGGRLSLHASHQTYTAAPEGTVTPAVSGNYVVVTVSDTGIGIPSDITEQIFDPFFTTKEIHKGTGLGLSTALGVIKGHGGFIKVQSIPGEGSSFTVFLPSSTDASAATIETNKVEVPRGHGELILFVDDEEALREVVSIGLERLNYRPLTAADGAQGLARVLSQGEDIAAVITDLHMPNMDGLTMARELRQQRPHLPVLVTSGRMDDHVAAELYALGVTSLLFKPFTEKQLALALEALLEEKRPDAC